MPSDRPSGEPTPMSTRSLRAGAAALALIVVAALAAQAFAERSGLQRVREEAQHRLDMVGANLDAELARFEYLPSLLEMNPEVFRLLETPASAAVRDAVNRYLSGVNAAAGSSTLYVLDPHGVGVAASDWNEASNPIGTDLSFRPYVKQALSQRRGRFYGIGVTSGRAGYYLSLGLDRGGGQRGVAIVKISLDDAERAWAKLPGEVLLLDERGVVILSTHPDWKFRPLAPLSTEVLADIAATRPYGGAELAALDWRVQDHLAADADIVSLAGNRYLATGRPLQQTRWRLLVLDDTMPVQAASRTLAFTAALAMAVLCLLGVAQWQRQRAVRFRLANQAALQAAHDSLESKVTQRTTELLTSNARLAEEVSVRKAIEADLRATQGELVQAGKMAALGQMSAGVVHELNQPLAALRTLSDNACVMLDRAAQPHEGVRGNLQHIAQLVDRLGRLTYQLKSFAHKANTPRVPVSVQQVIANAQFLVSHRLREQGVEVDVKLIPPALAAMADEARLEQVLVNLMGNAIDAMAASPTRCLTIEGREADGLCVLSVTDTGPGIRADILPRLFEPFTSSKPVGAGLGLGLMISANIVREFGGSLRAVPAEAGGARFVIELPCVPALQGAEHE